MEWIRIGTAADFPLGELHVRHLLGRAVGIRQHAPGEFSGLDLSCRHQGADLSAGVRQGTVVTCPRHAWRYDLATGGCLTEPDLPLRPVEVRLDGATVFVRLGSRLAEGEPL